MTQPKNTGGPAFPSIGSKDVFTSDGMTLRDYFAAKAMVGICHFWVQNPSLVSKMAYEMADAMLEASKS